MLESVESRYWSLWKIVAITVAYIAIFLFVVFITTQTSYAAQTVPYKINYQGRLTDSSGNPLANGNYNMKLRLFSAASGGTAVWTETRDVSTQMVSVTNGQFAVQLGDVTALSPSTFTTQPLYLEVELPSVATATCSTASCAAYTEGPMTPRQPLASAAYAMNADTLDGYDSSSFILSSANNTFTGANLFKNSANSAAAFGVQKSDGTSLMNVNTTSGAVSLGYNTTTLNPDMTLTSTGNVGIGTTAPGSTLEVDGSALFKSVTNSSTAFLIQNSGGVGILTADTTNTLVQIGSSTADSTAVLLVLDTKNTAGDPTGSAGAMYYNSSIGKFRCYENGAWVNCTGYQNVVTSSVDTANSTTTLSDVTGLTFPVTAGQTYHFSALINYTAAATTTGSRWSINGPTSSMLSYTSTYTLSATASTVNYASAYNMPAAANTGSLTAANTAKVEGVVTASASGTVAVRFASSTTSAITAKGGSTLTWW
jgi:hypothetical protein